MKWPKLSIVSGIENIRGGVAATIGMFDGVHRGHAMLLRELRQEARERAMRPVAITFSNHPMSVVNPARTPPLLLPLTEKKRLLDDVEGVKTLILEFDRELMSYNSFDWMRVLHDFFNVRFLLVGYDNTFGKDGRDMRMIDFIRFGEDIGIEVKEGSALLGVSSSAVRRAVLNGEMNKAKDLLGRPFEMWGKIVKGERNGHKIGFPTANFMTDEGTIRPAMGVYAGQVRMPDGKLQLAMVNVGVRPTIGDLTAPLVEAHLINWDGGDLYGKSMSVLLHERLRDERKFDTLEDLKAQLEQDKEATLKSASTAFGLLL